MATQDLPGSGASATPPLPSGDPVLPANLVPPEIMNQVRAALSTEQMKVLASTETQKKFERVVEGMITGLVAQSLTKMDQTSAGHAKVTALASIIQSGGLPAPGTGVISPATPVRAPSSPRVGSPEAGHPASSAPVPPERVYSPSDPVDLPGPTPRLIDQYREGRNNTSMGSIGQQISQVMSHAISQRSANIDKWSLETAEDGSRVLRKYAPDAAGADGTRGAPIGEIKEGSSGFGRTLAKVRMGSFISGGLAQAAKGEGIIGGLGSIGAAVSKFAGPVGMAVAAGSMFTGQLEKQNAAAATYRGDFGQQGTDNFASGDRFQEWLSGVQGIGTIGSERARAQFKAASSLGLRDDQRSQATDFSSQMYMKYGMDTAQSMQVVSQAIENGNISLSNFADSIKSVSESAVAAGRSSQTAINAFLATQASLASGVVGGEASRGIAQNLTNITSGMDRQTANAFGGPQGLAATLQSQSAVMSAAGQSGQDPLAAAYNLGAGGNRSVNQANRTLASTATVVIQGVAQVFGLTPAQMKSDAQNVAVDGDVPTDAGETLWREKWSRGNLDIAETSTQVLAALLRQFGQDSGQQEGNRKKFFLMLMGGMSGGSRAGGRSPSAGATQGLTKGDEVGNAMKLRHSLLGAPMGPTRYGPTNPEKTAFGDYVSLASSTGKGDAAIEGAISKNKEISAFTGVKGAQTYIVKDANGHQKSVSLDDIVKNPAYRAQMDAGTVHIKGKDPHEVKAISDFVPGLGGPGSSSGGSGGGSQQVGTLKIDMSDVAKRMLKVSGPTDAERSGTPSAPIYNPDSIPIYRSK